MVITKIIQTTWCWLQKINLFGRIRATPTEATSWYFRYLMAFGLINLSLSITALVFDILTVRYFTQTIYKCESKERQGVCFCSATEAQFRDLFEGLGTLDCNNNVIKNPSILVVNVCFDFICNWIAVVITVLLLHKVICIAITEAKLTRERRLLDESDTRHQISSPSPPDNSQDWCKICTTYCTQYSICCCCIVRWRYNIYIRLWPLNDRHS